MMEHDSWSRPQAVGIRWWLLVLYFLSGGPIHYDMVHDLQHKQETHVSMHILQNAFKEIECVKGEVTPQSPEQGDISNI